MVDPVSVFPYEVVPVVRQLVESSASRPLLGQPINYPADGVKASYLDAAVRSVVFQFLVSDFKHWQR